MTERQMNNRIQISSWGIRHNLGPIILSLRAEDGTLVPTQVTEGEEVVSQAGVPEHLKLMFGVTGIEMQDCYLTRISDEERAGLRQNLRSSGVTLGALCIEDRCIGEADERYR